MATKNEILPTDHPKVIDLVRQSGIDVSEWSSGKGGEKGAATNPHFCYEWAFSKPGSFIILNIWHHDIEDEGGALFQHLNPRGHAQKLANSKTRKPIAARALRMDAAIQTAVREHLPVRVIVVAGSASERNHIEGKPLRVKARMLDPVPWAVTSYDQKTGACTITRGATPDPFIDQFTITETPGAQPERREISGQAFVRDPEVRRLVRLRAQGKCEVCGQPGFKTASGSVYLETHHIIPLSEGGLDSVSNVVAICPNHHREAHHGEARGRMREELTMLSKSHAK